MSEKKRFLLISKGGQPCKFVSLNDILYIQEYAGPKEDGWLSTVYFINGRFVNTDVKPCVIYNRLTNPEYIK